jgi:hypothetical protein
MLGNSKIGLWMLLMTLPTAALQAQQDFSHLTAAEIVDQVDRILRGDSS